MTSSSSTAMVTDERPSMLWVTIPPVLLLSMYYIRKWYLARKLRKYGIGKGAPGFQTNVKRLRVTPEIAARIRRGEDVSPQEIEAASRKADLEEEAESRSGRSTSANANPLPGRIIEERDDRDPSSRGYSSAKEPERKAGSVDNDWLPDSISNPKKRGKGKKR